MAILEANITIKNNTWNTITKNSSSTDEGHAPQHIESKQTPNFRYTSNWTDVGNSVTYQLDSQHTATMSWRVSGISGDQFLCSISPDDGQFSISRAGDGSGMHCTETYTIGQLY